MVSIMPFGSRLSSVTTARSISTALFWSAFFTWTLASYFAWIGQIGMQLLFPWHAGRSSWQGRDACNDYSIGIELEGLEGEPFEKAQYDTLGRLMRAIGSRYPVDGTRELTARASHEGESHEGVPFSGA